MNINNIFTIKKHNSKDYQIVDLEKIFKNYFELDSLEEYVEKNIYPPKELGKNKKYWLIAADKPYPHPGIMEQQFYYSQFFKKFDEIKKI